MKETFSVLINNIRQNRQLGFVQSLYFNMRGKGWRWKGSHHSKVCTPEEVSFNASQLFLFAEHSRELWSHLRRFEIYLVAFVGSTLCELDRTAHQLLLFGTHRSHKFRTNLNYSYESQNSNSVQKIPPDWISFVFCWKRDVPQKSQFMFIGKCAKMQFIFQLKICNTLLMPLKPTYRLTVELFLECT